MIIVTAGSRAQRGRNYSFPSFISGLSISYARPKADAPQLPPGIVLIMTVQAWSRNEQGSWQFLCRTPAGEKILIN
jgi:hypothetical protein